MSYLKEKYQKEILPSVGKDFDVKNAMALPRIIKICISMGMGAYHSDVKKIDQCAEELTLIAGQRAVKTFARKSEASFKVREGMPIGVRVTLRGQRMWDFMDRFLNIAAPRISDFRGFSRKGFDGAGNYSFGISEQSIFPEVDLDKIEISQGMNFNIVFENSDPKKSEKVLEELGFPFTRQNIK